MPVIVTTTHTRTSVIVQAMKQGAFTLLEKPYEDDALRDAVGEAIARNESERAEEIKRRIILNRIASLSEKERMVMDLMIVGLANKVIAKKLNVSVRTVESRRHDVFEKMEVQSIAELVHTVVDTAR